MKLSLKKVLAAMFVCGCGLMAGSAHGVFAAPPAWYENSCLCTSNGEKIGDIVFGGAANMNQDGDYVAQRLAVVPQKSATVGMKDFEKHDKSVLNDLNSVYVEVIENGTNETLFSDVVKRNEVTNEFEVNFEKKFDSDSEVTLNVKASKDGEILATKQQTMFKSENNCPRFIDNNGNVHKADILVFSNAGKGSNDWYMDMPLNIINGQYSKGSFLKNYEGKNLVVKIVDATTEKELASADVDFVKNSKEDANVKDFAYFKFRVNVAGGNCKVKLFEKTNDGLKYLGEFKDVKLDSSAGFHG